MKSYREFNEAENHYHDQETGVRVGQYQGRWFVHHDGEIVSTHVDEYNATRKAKEMAAYHKRMKKPVKVDTLTPAYGRPPRQKKWVK